MKKLLIAFFSIFTFSLGGCLKDTPNVDFSNLPPMAEFEFPDGGAGNGLGSGLEFFSGGSLLFDPADEADTLDFMVNIAAPNPLGTAVTVTIGVDPTIVDAYNADPNNDVKYLNMPDSCYSLISTTGTVPAGKYLTPFAFVFYPAKFAQLDQTVSYMAPVKIMSASGTGISDNFSTIYFHTIGNKLAGTYNGTGTRYNYIGNVSYTYPGPIPPPASTNNLAPNYPKTASPVSPTTFSFPYANLVSLGYYYEVTFDETTFEITDVSPNAAMAAGISNWKVYYANYDVATKTFHLITGYNNVADPAGSGNDRIVDETFTHQ